MWDDLRDSFWGCVTLIIFCVVFAAIAYPLLWLRTTFIFKPALMLAYPFLVMFAWKGYPMAYKWFTGYRFLTPYPSDYPGTEPQRHESFYDVGSPTPEEKILLRRQWIFRLVFLLAVLVLSEAWLIGLGTSWRAIFFSSSD
jgi:hypothetical protein